MLNWKQMGGPTGMQAERDVLPESKVRKRRDQNMHPKTSRE